MRFLAAFLIAAAAWCAPTCDLAGYKVLPGLLAENTPSGLRVTWQGASGQMLRATFTIERTEPRIHELAIQKAGTWVALAQDLAPEFHVTSGLRRISEQQLAPLRQLGVALTPEVIDREKWNVFWDAPLRVPGSPRTNPGLPRKPEEIRRATATFQSTSCAVKTDGARLEVSFPGLSMGIFAGRLQFTVYKGANLLRQEAIAKTGEPSVAYKYSAGLKGFRPGRVVWRDVARGWQKYEFGGAPNTEGVSLRARNRIAVVETAAGSIGVFPPPKKFFFAREIELNLGYVFYRKDSAASFAAGVRQPDHEEGYRPFGFSDEVWQKRVGQARGFAMGNFALYNAPAGTWQRMPVYYYLSAAKAQPTADAILAFTHEDRFKAVPGYQVAISHFHTHFNEQVADAGSLDFQPPWVPTFRELGVNIAMMSDFHGDGHPGDAGPLRFQDQKTYFDACARHSDRDFLIMPGEEPDATFGGHYTTVFPRPVFWSHVRKPDQPFVENHPKFGKVYHVGSERDELEMLRAEGGLSWQAHPRTKGSTGYPESSRDKEYFRSDRFLGGSYQSLPVDLSESRICEKRCFSTLDDMNNWAGPKYLIAEGDTYAKYPDDETYPHLLVNYVKLDRLPLFNEDWSPILKSMRAGEFFVSSGEVLFRRFALEGSGAKRTVVADLEWTFPLEFVEVVWGDGQKTDRQILRVTDRPPFGSERFRIPFDAAGKKWVRVAAWDSAGSGAFWQPVHLSANR
ncbi:MAG: hypothetical protein ACKV22_01150 [Bryobacteraceae bacterium]